MNKYQAKLTEDEIKSALVSVALKIAHDDVTEELVERFNYLGKRLLKIQKGEPEIENETTQAQPEKGWG